MNYSKGRSTKEDVLDIYGSEYIKELSRKNQFSDTLSNLWYSPVCDLIQENIISKQFSILESVDFLFKNNVLRRKSYIISLDFYEKNNMDLHIVHQYFERIYNQLIYYYGIPSNENDLVRLQEVGTNVSREHSPFVSMLESTENNEHLFEVKWSNELINALVFLFLEKKNEHLYLFYIIYIENEWEEEKWGG